MGEMIPKPVKKLWDKWNVRGVIILSLFLQSILIFFAPSRKRTAKKLFLVLIWSAYLLADWAADYAVGQISDSQEDEAEDQHSKNRELLAFWSPFLLLHLGGPDTITALALEDNELWDRHLFSLVCQAIATIYVILLSIPNRLLTPTVIMLVGGVIRYVERTAALFSASLDKCKDSMLDDPNPGANYAKLMEEYEAKREMNMPTEVIVVEDTEKGRESNTPIPRNDLTHLQVVQYAYRYYNTFKGLIVDLIFTNQQRDESRKFFDKLNSGEALSIIDVELSLIYDSLFTKAEILQNLTGVVFRFIALGCLVTSLCLFKMNKQDQYDGFDVALTYALLICGIALDSIALLMFCVSDWTIARLRNLKDDLDEKDNWIDGVLSWMLSFRAIRWKRTKDGHHVLNRYFMFRRWSEYVHACNLIGYCLKIRPQRIHHTKGKIHSFFNDDIVHVLFIDIAIDGTQQCFRAMNQVNRQLYKWIDRILRNLYKENRVIRRVVKPIRRFLLRCFVLLPRLGRYIQEILDFFGTKDLYEEIRFTTSDRLTKELWEFIFKQVKHKHRFAEDQESAKGISSARGDWTLVETSSKKAKDGFDYAILLRYVTEKDYDQSILLWHIATELLYQNQIEKEIADEEEYTNREFSKILSDYMMYLLIMQPTLMSAVFCFAATHCDSQEHASQLSRGGELLNFVWLLMAHFGLGDQFQINRDDARAKLIVAK